MQKIYSVLGTVILFSCIIQKNFAQTTASEDPYFYSNFTHEVGMSLGFMNCLTDIGGGKGIGKKFVKDINLSNTEPEGSIFFSTAYRNMLVLRTEMVWGILKSSDAVLKNVKESTGGRYERNLSFRTSIFELSLVGEIHPLYFKKYRRDQQLPRFSPYLLGGIGYFVFNPQAKLDGEWVNLRPLHTEGQGFAEYPDRKVYKLKQLNFPVGAGIRLKVTEEINFSVEGVYRILTTDYLDDVSTTYVDRNLFQKYLDPAVLNQALQLQDRQKEINPTHVTTTNDIRGNSQKNDAYFSLNFKVSYSF
jgi:hypothetical protein